MTFQNRERFFISGSLVLNIDLNLYFNFAHHVKRTEQMKAFVWPLALGILLSTDTFSQPENARSFTPAIEDNSMFLEEAYNQEEKVVQHISNFFMLPNLQDNFFYAFTQEWPAFGLKHQLSYTILYSSLNNGSYQGVGDILLNYRYQLSYKENFVACSPRFSLIIPTGSKSKGIGHGAWGWQANLPVSKRWSNHFVNHFNIGTTSFFNVKAPDFNFNATLFSYFAGLSSIWLVTEKFNLMLECMTNRDANPGKNNKIEYINQTVLAPAFRFAVNMGKVQVVPGVSVPFTFIDGAKAEVGGFLYLSFEHAY